MPLTRLTLHIRSAHGIKSELKRRRAALRSRKTASA